MRTTNTKEQVINIINKKINQLETNLQYFEIVREHVKQHEGKKYTRRYLSKLDKMIVEKFGSSVFKYGKSFLKNDYSWKKIKLELINEISNGYSFSYQLHYDSQEKVTLEEFDRLNTCHSEDRNRLKRLHALLSNNELLDKYCTAIDKVNEGFEFLESCHGHKENASDIQFDIKHLLAVKEKNYDYFRNK